MMEYKKITNRYSLLNRLSDIIKHYELNLNIIQVY